MLHGWGLHGGVFSRVAERLAASHCVHLVDLPGHGASAPLASFDADAVADLLDQAFPLPAQVVGWSLGGLVAQHWAARHPDKIKSLALVATSPRFVRDELAARAGAQIHRGGGRQPGRRLRANAGAFSRLADDGRAVGARHLEGLARGVVLPWPAARPAAGAGIAAGSRCARAGWPHPLPGGLVLRRPRRHYPDRRRPLAGRRAGRRPAL